LSGQRGRVLPVNNLDPYDELGKISIDLVAFAINKV
jgi:hypothetical protein